MQFFNRMPLFDDNAREKAGSYITKAIIHEGRWLSRIRKNFNPEEEAGKRPVVVGRDARRQDTKGSLQKSDFAGGIINIAPNAKEGQKDATKHDSGGLVPLQTLKKARE